MSVKIRLSRGGAKKRPYYYVVVAHGSSPRDGRYIEQIGTFDPMLKKDDPNRVKLSEDRVKHWLGVGAQPTDRVLRLLDTLGSPSGPPPIIPRRQSRRKRPRSAPQPPLRRPPKPQRQHRANRPERRELRARSKPLELHSRGFLLQLRLARVLERFRPSSLLRKTVRN